MKSIKSYKQDWIVCICSLRFIVIRAQSHLKWFEEANVVINLNFMVLVGQTWMKDLFAPLSRANTKISNP